MKKLIFTAFAILTISSLQAQQLEELTFNEKTHDFGTIQETAGPVSFKFEFTNNSAQPLKVLSVKASCGCTTPGWTKEEVAPGGTGYVEAQYNPANRPGPFHKSLTITTTGNTKRHLVYIKGSVTPKPKSLEEEFPVVMGDVRWRYKSFNFGKVKTDKPTAKEFEFYNDSDQPLSFEEKIEGPGHISVSFDPTVIQPKEKGKIVLTYDSQAREDLGFIVDNIAIAAVESTEKMSFAVYATIEEYFAPMTSEELAAAPRLSLENSVHDFGRVSTEKSVSTKFLLTNSGKKPLNIRKTHSTCGCTVSKLAKTDLEPGETTEIEVTFNAKGRRGNQQKSITIFTNDPVRPTQRITIKAQVI